MGRALKTIAFKGFGVLVLLSPACLARAQDAQKPNSSMAPLEQYLMERNAEIALARSAAAQPIAGDADVSLGKHGHETSVRGKNGFVCMVQRSWAAGFNDPEFWNPKLRSPICFNPPGVRSYLPLILKKTDLVLAGRSIPQMIEAISAAINKKELPGMEPGAMGYMLSRQGYLSDRDGHWHPHLMFCAPLTDPLAWGAGLPASPILGFKDDPARLTVFLIPVGKWSDGTVDAAEN
jgi:hypothetical protein